MRNMLDFCIFICHNAFTDSLPGPPNKTDTGINVNTLPLIQTTTQRPALRRPLPAQCQRAYRPNCLGRLKPVSNTSIRGGHP
jgi:hypothetical protein